MDAKIKDLVRLLAETSLKILEEFDEAIEDNEVIDEKKANGFDKVSKDEPYYWVNVMNKVVEGKGGDAREGYLYNAANYYGSIELAERFAFEETLMRELRRFAAERAGYPITLAECDNGWAIYWDEVHGLYCDYVCGTVTFGDVLFNSREAADEAIERFGPDLEYYFTGKVDAPEEED